MIRRRESGARGIVFNHLLWAVISGLVFGVFLWVATGRPLVSLLTGFAMCGAIEVADLLNRALVRTVLRRLPCDGLRLGLDIGSLLIGHILGAGLALLACSRLFHYSVRDTGAWWVVAGMVVAFPVVHGTQSALRLHRRLRDKDELEDRLRAMATEAELKALKAQVNPHFLFNALNTIAALIHTDPALAERSVERLCGMFRYALAASERGLVPLEEELGFVDDYLQIERARFGGKLCVTRETDPHALSVPVPSLILQPLVENAVKHGSGVDGRVDVTIRVDAVDGGVRVTIADRGPGMPPGQRIDGSSCHGLGNVNQRLHKTYGVACGLDVTTNHPRGTIVTVRVPIARTGATCAS